MVKTQCYVLVICRILHGNVLIGTIPREIGLLKNLKVLDLGSNQLTGPIPLELGNLSNIMKMLVQFEYLFVEYGVPF